MRRKCRTNHGAARVVSLLLLAALVFSLALPVGAAEDLTVEDSAEVAASVVDEPEVSEEAEAAETAEDPEEPASAEASEDPEDAEPLEETEEEPEETEAEQEVQETVETVTQTVSGTDYAVTVSYAENVLPSGVALTVSELSEAQCQERLAQYLESIGEELTEDAEIYARLFDVGFVSGGEKVEPDGEVSVSIKLSDSDVSEDADLTVVHFKDDETVETLAAETEAVAASDAVVEVTFTTDSFSEIMTVDDDWGITLTSSSNEMSQSYYNGNHYVYWDTMTATETSGSTVSSFSLNHSASGNIQSVTLNEKDVINTDSSSKGWVSNQTGNKLGTYFPNASSSAEEKVTLTITPADGYYVTAVVVACDGTGQITPDKCATFTAGNAFSSTFSLSASGSVSLQVSSTYFSHSSSKEGITAYFILIAVAPIPSPLYVEYDYGDIVTKGANSNVFSDHDAWVTASSLNDYGRGEIQTDYTQFMYAYEGEEDASKAAAWKHYANTVTDEAKAAAAEAGYYFVGWEAQYYTSVSVSEDDSTHGDYTYTFSNSYGSTDTTYAEGAEVKLTTNVRLIAQWEPYTITVQKVVAGDSDDVVSAVLSEARTYNVSLTDSTTTSTTTYNASLTVTSSSDAYTASKTISPVIRGTYTISETDAGETITVGTTSYYCTTTYSITSGSTTQDASSLTITTDDIINNTPKIVTVTNTYTTTPPTVSVTITKTVTGPMGDRSKSFNFVVSSDKTMSLADQTDDVSINNNGDFTFSLTNNDYVTLVVPVGAVLTINETNASDYDTTITVDGVAVEEDENGNLSVTVGSSTQNIVVNNYKDASPDMGLTLDTLPYLMLLALALGGGMVLLRRRRRC